MQMHRASTASSPEALLVAMSSSTRTVRGSFRPSSWMSACKVVSDRMAPTMLVLMLLGNSLQCLEKCWM